MFTGEGPGRRKINLGGKTQIPVDRQALLEQTRREREAREFARKRTDAAVRIGRLTRGFFVRKRVKLSLLDLLETLCIGDDSCGFSAYGAKNPLTVLVLLNFMHTPSNIAVNAQTLKWIGERLSLQDIGAGPMVAVRASALIHQLLLNREVSYLAGPLVSFMLGRNTLKFVPNTDEAVLELFKVSDSATAVRILEKLLEFGSSVGIVQRCALAFFQEKASQPSEQLIDVALKLPLLSIETGTVFNVQEIAANLTGLVLFMMDRGRRDQVKRLMVSLSAIVDQLSDSGRASLDSFLLGKFLLPGSTTSGQYVLLELVRLESLPEETVYRLATQTKLVQEIGEELVSLFLHRPADGRIRGLVSRFTLLYSKVVAGISSVLSGDCLEKLFPLLNKYAYESIVRFAPVGESVFGLIRAVYGKRHLYQKLRSEEVWVFPESVALVPNSVYDLTLHEEEDFESMFREEPDESPKTTSKSVFDVLIEAMPHVIPFNRRLRIFASALAEDQLRHTRQAWSLRLPWEGSRVKKIRREHLLQDGLDVVSSASREVMRIEFVGRDGSVEAGIDGGGLFKEFMQQWTIGIMNPEFGLFSQLPNGRLTPSIDAYQNHPDADRLFRAAGRAVGKALYEMVLLETHLGEAFLSRVLGRPYSLDQLQEIDESLYRNLKFVCECDNVEDLGLTFSVSANGYELVPNGSELPVTSENKLRYVLLASWYYLARQLDRAATAFASGVSELLPLARLKLFSPSEINLLISGEQRKGFQVEELKANVVYGGGYSEHSETVKIFWEVLQEVSDDDRSAFLAFVTSARRPPLLGFRVLHPKFGINRVPEPDRLPTSSTCANLLKLPDYRDKNLLKRKLFEAIYSQSGFDLS
jgi:hypothetical protein